MKMFICKPYPKHFFEKFPFDWKHQVHKWTLGIILIEHIEPDGKLASIHHKDMIINFYGFVKTKIAQAKKYLIIR